MPTSITAAPGLTCSAPIIRGTPTAAISTSAGAHTCARSRVREWQIVTVALRSSRSIATGLARRGSSGRRRRPRPPRARHRGGRAARSPRRGARPQPRLALGQVPGIDRREPVDVLRRVDQRGQRPGRPGGPGQGAGAGSRSPPDRRSARRSVRPRPRARRRPAGGGRTARSPPRATPSACRRRRSAEAGSVAHQDRGQPGRRPAGGDQLGDLARHLLADLAGDLAAVDDRGALVAAPQAQHSEHDGGGDEHDQPGRHRVRAYLFVIGA